MQSADRAVVLSGKHGTLANRMVLLTREKKVLVGSGCYRGEAADDVLEGLQIVQYHLTSQQREVL